MTGTLRPLLPVIALALCVGCASDGTGETPGDPSDTAGDTASATGTSDAVADTTSATLDVLSGNDTPSASEDAAPLLPDTQAPSESITFHFAYGTEPVGMGASEVTLYASDEVENYGEAPGFQIDVRVQTIGVGTGGAVTLYVDGEKAAEWLVIEGMETLFQMVTLPLSSPNAPYPVRVEATSTSGIALEATKLVTLSEAPPPTNTPPAASCDTLEQLLMAQMAMEATGCETDEDCDFLLSPICDLGPHLTCHVLAHRTDADITGIEQLLTTYTDEGSGCDVMVCDCQGTGAGCFSGLCKPTGY
ncbi:MAG: hypothetical protein VX938_12535 [Myxococcota bacterium]|nr:hypothetical protein [Myxococcota bacterium]